MAKAVHIQYPVLVIGDRAIEGVRDSVPLASRLSTAMGALYPHALSSEGIGRGQLDLWRLDERARFSTAVICFGIDDAPSTPSPRAWKLCYQQIVSRMIKQVSEVVVLLPWEVQTGIGQVASYDRNARRWVLRIRASIAEAIGGEMGLPHIQTAFNKRRIHLVDPMDVIGADDYADDVWLKPSGYESIAEHCNASIADLPLVR